jgi:hypothetical protein
MIRSLGSAGLVLVTLGAGLGLYFVSFSVGQERTTIEQTARQIARDRHDIRALQAELRVRSNLPQLERWNTQSLALGAPKSGQILESEVQLAALVEPGTPPLAANVQLASVQLPKPAPAMSEPAPAMVDETPEPGLFTAAFVAEIEAAAAGERAGLTKVALR